MPTSARRTRWSVVGASAVALALGGAAVVVAANVIELAEGRFVGQTSNEGSLFSAAVVDIELSPGDGSTPGSERERAATFAIDAQNLLPGDRVERCLHLRYRGTVDDAEIRMLGIREGGAGLDTYLETTVEIGEGIDPTCTDFVRRDGRYTGRLSGLWGEDADSGIALVSGAGDGDVVTVRVELELVDDQRAQGRDLRFWLALEVTA